MNIKRKIILGLAALFVLAIPATASAHVTVSPEEAPAGDYAMLTFTVPHGCDGAATTSVKVQMPPQVVAATPGVVPGWNIKTVEGKLPQPSEMHGEKITEGVRQVTWTGGPLADDQLQQFPLSVAFAGAEGDAAEFKVIQGCEGGAETAWIQSTPASGEEPEHPAPTVMMTAASEEGHDHMAAADDSAEAASADSSDDDGSDNGLAIAALIVGALGLVVGSVALVGSRRK
ncbi:MAG TPA: YcnI family protein [Solirubrobacterales bacterium]|nr:YcnI family protein [Solirubrobacterales bacterium]